MSETPLVKYKTTIYKEKLRIVQQENKQLLRSTTRLRIRCARKNQPIQVQAKALEKAAGKIPLGLKPKRHKYPVAVILMAVHFQAMVGLSYRQVQPVVRRFILMAELEISPLAPPAVGIKNGVSSAVWLPTGGKQYFHY